MYMFFDKSSLGEDFFNLDLRNTGNLFKRLNYGSFSLNIAKEIFQNIKATSYLNFKSESTCEI